MLNIGLIGDIHLLEPIIIEALEHPEVHITGKSSVGLHQASESIHIPTPEFNRIELIERADALIMNRFSLIPFQQLCSMVKKSKHIFTTTYPEFSLDECTHLIKLAHEAKTTVQITNPFYYLPALQWLNQNLKKPSYLSVTYSNQEIQDTHMLVPFLLMLKDMSGSKLKKFGAVSFRSEPAGSTFNHVQVEFSNGLMVEFNFGKRSQVNEFKISAYAHNQFAFFDILKGTAFSNHAPLDLSSSVEKNETDSFIRAILQKKSCSTHLENFAFALQTAKAIQSKLEQF
ncbi:MAG: hypothetical protein WCY58_00615 [Mariniphaga sp.]|nr:hypothetical protein [Mariniphaga sp.]MDD4226227.1 hypothetical protein [Mariniphaga sp.]